jgi:hypothetical protein
MADTHRHDAQLHQHEHTHVTSSAAWPAVGHMDASQVHEHHHAVIYVDELHQDPDNEHGSQAHIHDHEQPAQSPTYADRPAAARERAPPTFAQVPSGP